MTRGRENNHQNYVTNEGGASLRPRTLAMSAPADAASAVEEKPKAPDPPKRFVRNQVLHRGAHPALSMRVAFRHSAAADNQLAPTADECISSAREALSSSDHRPRPESSLARLFARRSRMRS